MKGIKGVILAGGFGTRLGLLTKITNKHLLPVYNKPMILYPLQKLLDADIKEILIVSGPEHSGHFLRLLGSGREFKARFTYEIQDEAGGIAQALGLAENFVDGENVAVILGDNIFEDNLANEIKSFKGGAKIFLKKVSDANRFGVAEIRKNKIVNIEEKPKNPKTNYAVTGFYLYDSKVFNIIKTLKPSGRREYEIKDVNNYYINQGLMGYSIINGFWSDSGTFESLFMAAEAIRDIEKKKKLKTA